MTEETSVLVFGMDERASAIARKLHLDGYAVALHQPSPPTIIRRRMAFADAWYEGSVTFEGVEARRSDKTKDFLAGLRSGQFIPILWHNFDEVTERWPWDVLVDALPASGRARPPLKNLADLSIGVGPGFVAGETCDIVIDTRAGDPGAVLRSGSIAEPELPRDDPYADGTLVYSPEGGLFQVSRFIGETVNPGDVLGLCGNDRGRSPGLRPAARARPRRCRLGQGGRCRRGRRIFQRRGRGHLQTRPSDCPQRCLCDRDGTRRLGAGLARKPVLEALTRGFAAGAQVSTRQRQALP